MKTKLLSLFLCLVSSAVSCLAQNQLPIINSPAALKDYAMDQVASATWTISSPAIVSHPDGISSLSIDIEGPNDTITLAEHVATLRHDYSVDVELAASHDLLSHLVYLDSGENPLFEGSKHVPFVIRNGVVHTDEIGWIDVDVVDEIPIQFEDDLVGGEIILSCGQRVRVNVEGDTFFFPSDYAGEPGKLVLVDVWNSLSVFDLESGERSWYQSISGRLTWTSIKGVYGLFPIEGSETVQMFPWWWGDGDEVWEVNNTSTLILTNNQSRPYVVVIKNIDTGVTASHSVESGSYSFVLDSGDRYRVWFDWKQPEPDVILLDQTTIQEDPGSSMMSLVSFTYQVTANASDIYIPRYGSFGWSINQVGPGFDNPKMNSSASVLFMGGAFVTLDGEEYYRVREGETATLSLVLNLASSGSAVYEVSAPTMWFRYGSWNVLWEKYIPGTRRTLYTGGGKG